MFPFLTFWMFTLAGDFTIPEKTQLSGKKVLCAVVDRGGF